MCSKRLFTKNDLNINYKDYIVCKNGSEMLKTIKAEDNNAVLNKFTNYNSWQTMSSAYYANIDINSTDLLYLENIYYANNSFIHPSCSIDKSICENERNILYPYGNVITQKQPNVVFPSKLYLCKWFNKNTCNNRENIKLLTLCNNDNNVDFGGGDNDEGDNDGGGNGSGNNQCNCIGKKPKPLFIKNIK